MRIEEAAKQTARMLRRRATPAERVLWELIRDRRVMGKKFLRQHPIFFDYFDQRRFVVADACCAEHRLIVELDGGVHLMQEGYDAYRPLLVEKEGYHVIRFKNEDLAHPDFVVASLASALSALPSLFQREGTQG